MKRRNAECGKLRRPLKRSKITEGIYGSTFMYVKFVMVWALVLLADFILEFRFEYLWPFWLLLRSVSDSFKYQGLAFSVFFVCVAVTSDVICYIFIPVNWLFFAASTYVWVQYVWHTERGVCLPTVSLWLLFVYIEASVRLREFTVPRSLPFHLDLCRPFAAHCIGYPVVTLGFGFKSYVSYRFRVRKQKDVQKENDFYIQLLQQALPADLQQPSLTDKQKALPNKSQEEVISNSVVASNNTTPTPTITANGSTKKSNKDTEKEQKEKERAEAKADKKSSATVIEDYQLVEQTPPPSKRHNVNDFEGDAEDTANNKSYKANGVTKTANKLSSHIGGKKGKNINSKVDTNNTHQLFTNNKEDSVIRMESDMKRLKADLQGSRNTESELRSQINNHLIGDKTLRNEVYQLRHDNENLQNKLHNLVTSRQQDKATLAQLDKKLAEERKSKSTFEQQLITERKNKRLEEAAAARALAMANTRGECTDSCKIRRRELESEINQTRRELQLRQDQIRQLERDSQTLRQYQDAQNETEVLMSALSAMQDKNAHLEKSLSAETRLKLDLFSALGEAKRQIEIHQGLLLQREQEIRELKSKVAEVMALSPYASVITSEHNGMGCHDAMPHFSSSFTIPTMNGSPPKQGNVLTMSSLNPNASDYTPVNK